MNKKILHIEIQSADKSLQGFEDTLLQIESGKKVDPYFSIGFESLPQFAAVFTPKRWELIGVLKKSGAMSIYQLAKLLKRHYRNVHKDVTALMKWMIIEKDEDSHVFIPWDEIDMRLPLNNGELKEAA